MTLEPEPAGTHASAMAATATLAELVRAAEVLGLPADARDDLLDRLRRSRRRSLDRLRRASALAVRLARHDGPAALSPDDHDALDLLFHATRQALADLASGDRIAVEDAFVARAGAVPRSLGREPRPGPAAVPPASASNGRGHTDQSDRMKG